MTDQPEPAVNAEMPWDDFPDDDTDIPGPGADYIPTGSRAAAWAGMAADLAQEGFGPAEIADALCVDQPTVARLLKLAGSSS